MEVAIIRSGNTGSACAFMAAETGHKVKLLKTANYITHDKHFERMVELTKEELLQCVEEVRVAVNQNVVGFT